MIERSLFEYLVNTLWQLPLLLAATWLLLRLTRPVLLAQHILWMVALLLGVLLPLRGIAWSAPAPAVRILFTDEPREPLPTALPASFAPHIQPLQLADRTIDWLLELYAVSIAFSLARLTHGLLATRRLTAAAEAHPLTTLEAALLRACADRVHLPASRIPGVRFLAGPSAGPMAAGIRHPVLLLPTALRHAAGFDDRALAAVFSHELAHIRRRDFLANLLTRLAALPIAYHPATHILHARIRQTREMLCDAEAAGAVGSPSTYARSLLALAAGIAPQRNLEAVGLFDHTQNLEERIMKLTEPTLAVTLTQRVTRMAAGIAILLASTAGAATLHLKMSSPVVVYAAQTPVQTPRQPAAPPAAPEPPAPPVAATPAAMPALHSRHSTKVVDGKVRDLTPEEQKQLGEQMNFLQSPEFKKQIADAANIADNPEFRKSMEDLTSHFNSPEFKRQMDEAARASAQMALNSADFKRQMDEMKRQMNSPEFRKQIEDAKRQATQGPAEFAAHQAEMRKQLAQASHEIDEAKKQIHDEAIQKQLEEAQRKIDAATRN